MFTNNDIARHFENCEDHYKYWWDLKKSKSMHYGYWDENTHTLHEALMNINKIMSQKAGITKESNVLDAGCGVGGSSLWMAANIGCSVTGITLSEKQKDKANGSALQLGLSEKAVFFQKDFCATGFPDAGFDVVWAIESVCYAANKNEFIKEPYRVLKSGGRLIVADFFKKEGLAGKEKAMIDAMAYGWAVTDFSTIEAFQNFSDSCGFKHLQIQNISEAIKPSAKKLYRYSFPGMFLSKLYDLFFTSSEVSKYQARTINIQYTTLKKGLWEYLIFTAEK